MENHGHTNIKVEVSDPTALGLFGLAMVTLAASSQKLGLTQGVSFLLPWVVFLGAIAQLMASAYDFKHKNLFGSIVFAAYGLFWLGVGASWLIKMGAFGAELSADVDVRQLGVAFLGYSVFSLIATAVAFKLNTFLSLIMIAIDILLISLTLDSFGLGHAWHSVAAYSELLISIMSFYGAAGAFLNNAYGRVIIPMGKAWTK